MKGVKGWNFYSKSANLAVKSISLFSNTTKTLGYLSTAYSAYKFLNNPNWLDGTEAGVSVGSYFFWEVGATYYAGKFIITTQKSALNTLIDNRHGDNPAIINPVTW